MNLSELHSIRLNGFNGENFIAFHHRQPKFKYFYHKQTLTESMQPWHNIAVNKLKFYMIGKKNEKNLIEIIDRWSRIERPSNMWIAF